MYQDEHSIFREAFQQFIAEEVTPNLEEWEADHLVPKLIFEKLGENNFDLCRYHRGDETYYLKTSWPILEGEGRDAYWCEGPQISVWP